MGARRTAPNVVNTPTGTRPTREDERERMPIADDPVTRPSFFRSPAQERSASRIPMFTPEFKEKMKERIEREKFNDRSKVNLSFFCLLCFSVCMVVCDELFSQ